MMSFLALSSKRGVEQRLGSGLDSETSMGWLVGVENQMEVIDNLEVALGEGRKAAVGGGRPEGARLAHGCFVEPTLLTNVAREMSIWRSEVFGPVLAVREVEWFDEAVGAANDSRYGAVFTSSLRQARRFADPTDVGELAVNLPTSGWDVPMQFGGFREPGSAFKEQGLDALCFCSRTNTAVGDGA